MPLEVCRARSGEALDPARRDLILRSVHEAAKLIKEGKGATHYGIASAIGRIGQVIVHHTHLILAIVHPEVEGMPEACWSLPRGVNGCGAPLSTDPELDPTERSALIVKEATDSVLPGRQGTPHAF